MSDFNWNNVSNDLEVINLFVEREKIEAKIKALDEFSLVKYEYEKLGLDPANEDSKETEKALVITDVSQQRELLIAAFERLDRPLLTMIEVGNYEEAVDELLSY